MAQDHFVAQTYLKHWTSASAGKLYGYSKVSGKEFPCQPKDVCKEWNWDINPRFKDNPRLLADFRQMFEPQWNPTVGAIRSGLVSIDDRFSLAGYWAQLTTCTPAWHNNAVELYEQQLADFIPLTVESYSREYPEHRKALEDAIAKGEIKPKIDEDHVKAILTLHLTDATFNLYEQDWTVLSNNTDAPFITSDNPSSVFPRRSFMEPLTRFLPLGPDLAVVMTTDPSRMRKVDSAIAINGLRPGALRRARIDRKSTVARLNRIAVMNADDIVLAPGPNRWTRRLTRNHRRLGIAVDHEKFSTPDGFIAGTTLVVRQRRD